MALDDLSKIVKNLNLVVLVFKLKIYKNLKQMQIRAIDYLYLEVWPIKPIRLWFGPSVIQEPIRLEFNLLS